MVGRGERGGREDVNAKRVTQSSVRFLVAKQHGEHIDRMRRIHGLENDAVPGRHLSVEPFKLSALQRLYEAAERVLG